MNRHLKKIISLFLILAMIVPFVDGMYTYASNSNPSLYDESNDYFTSPTKNGETWSAFKTFNGVPSDLPYKSDNGWFFNIEIWKDQHIAVYGDHTSMSGNDFKNATLKNYSGDDLTIGVKNQGYYKSNGLLGEYRYHGFDSKGNKYVNLDFPADSDSGRKPEEKKWIYQVWEKSSPYYKETRIERPSQYYQIAKLPTDKAKEVQAWIKETLPFKIENSTNANKDAYNYAHVLTAPTTRFPGQTLMYHQSDVVYYQMFSLNKRVQDKSKLELAPFIAVNMTGEGISATKEIDLNYEVKLTGIYRDNYLWSPYTVYEGVPVEVARTIYYTRDEIKSWTLTLQDTVTDEITTITNIKPNDNKGSNTFSVKIPYSKYKSKLTGTGTEKKLDIAFNGTITVYFYNGDSITQTISSLDTQIPPDPIINETGKQETPIVTEPPMAYEAIKMDIEAPRYMLDTETFKIIDGTNLPNGGSRTVFVEGQELSESDADHFLAGQHLFPLLGKDKIYTYSVTYTDMLGQHLTYSSYVVVYTTKPRAQFKTVGTFKENRKITVNTDFNSVNSAYLLSHATINNLSFDAASDNAASLKFKTKNANQMVFLVKDESELAINIKAQAEVPSNLIERSDIPSGYFVSDDYSQSYHIDKDYDPAIIANIWSSVMIRDETLDFTYDGSSYDDDTITINKYKIYYDLNGDSEPEQLVKQGNWDDYDGFSANKLGAYKIVFDIEESFGQETIEEFITSTDKRTASVERNFYVDNVAPVTAIESNIDVNIPKVDVMVLNDQGITRELNDEIKTKRVDWINALGQSKGVSANLQIWDLYTYIDTKSVTPTQNTGSSYPFATWVYSSGGYTGTLNRINVRDNGSYYDYGYSQAYTTCVDEPIMKWTWNGNICGWSPDDATIGLSCWYQDGTKTVCTTDYEWISDYRWVSNYYGDYQGTISKATKQTFSPTLDIDSEKYIIYFAKDKINNPSDLDTTLKKATSKVILVGNPALKGTISHYAFVDVNQPLANIMTEVNDIIGNDNALDNKKLLLVGETFETYFMDYDEEKDSLYNTGIQYVHEANYYDNSTGLEAGSIAAYSESAYQIQTIKTSFSKPGKYTIYRKLKDTIPSYTGYEKFSNAAQMEIYVHRKPIADFSLDWDYDASKSVYKTTWVDLSYDLDHQYSEGNKGIVDRKLMYRKTYGDNAWYYAIPTELTSGNYEMKYVVKDLEGVWSDETTMLFTLSAEPPIQLKAKLKSITPPYETSNIPASEKIQVYEIITNYHQAHNLKVSIYDDHGVKLKDEALLSNAEIPYNNIKGNIYNWQTCDITLPQIYQDGNYSVKIEAYSVINPAIKTIIDLPFHIQTPIDIVGDVDNMINREISHFTGKTNKYASTVNVILYKGTAYQTTVALKKSSIQLDSDTISWETDVLISEEIPEDRYILEFEALTPSNNRATYELNKEVMALKVKKVSITGYWNHWRGQIDVFGERMSFEPHRFLSYEKVIIKAEVIGDPDEVSVSFSPELEAMSYTNSLGQVYLYQTEVGFVQIFPIKLVKKSGDSKSSIWEGEYVLPLAKETISWRNLRLRNSYLCVITAKKALNKSEVMINDLEITGNIYDLLYHQPKYKN